MRPSSTTQLILTVSSWTGNVLLTALAVYLAWTHSGPLTPVTFLTLALCILLGNLLPISVHLINYWWSKALLDAEEKEASLSLRKAVTRIETIESRFEDLHNAASKAVLIARQVPERIEEKTEPWLQAIAALDMDRMNRLREALVDHEDRLRENLEQGGQFEERVRDAAETVNKLLESVSAVVDKLEQLANAPVPSAKEPKEPKEPLDAEDDADEPDPAPAAPSRKAVKKKVAKAEKGPSPQIEIGSLVAAVEADVQSTAEDRIVVVAKCMTGIRNRLFIRGEGGDLSWDEGTPMELTGIGEYRYAVEPADEPIRFKLLINDELWSTGDDFEAEPGQIVRVAPKFEQ